MFVLSHFMHLYRCVQVATITFWPDFFQFPVDICSDFCHFVAAMFTNAVCFRDILFNDFNLNVRKQVIQIRQVFIALMFFDGRLTCRFSLDCCILIGFRFIEYKTKLIYRFFDDIDFVFRAGNTKVIHVYSDTLDFKAKDCFYYQTSRDIREDSMRNDISNTLPISGFYELKQEIYDILRIWTNMSESNLRK